MKSIFFAFLLATPGMLLAKEKAPTQYTIPIPPPPDFSAFSWLTGNWTGHTTGKSPQGDLHFSAQFDLAKRVMILREKLSLASTKTTPATDESWMGILSPGRSAASFDLQVYSSTGFISRYQVTVDGSTISIVPAGGLAPPPGMLFRRTLEQSPDGGFTETVQVAPSTASFFNYYTAQFTPEAPATQHPAAPPATVQAPAKTPANPQ
jgi:hypothetical protein